MKKMPLGIVAVSLMFVGAGCIALPSPTVSMNVSTSVPTPKPKPTPPLAEAPMVLVNENDNNTTVHVMNGSTIDLVLQSTYWQIQPTDSAVLKPLFAEPSVKGELSRPPGMGTGTVEMRYRVLQTGTAVLTASRASCGEALRCTGTQGEFKVTIISDAAAATAAPDTVLVSAEDTTKYCNGADMNSDGYRQTITKEQPFTPAAPSASDVDRIRAVLAAATTGMCNTVMTKLDVMVKDGVAHVPPIDGWAGVSITMCSCKPQVEVNLLRLPGITSVVWE